MPSDHDFDCPCCKLSADRDDDGVPAAVKELELYDAEDWQGLVRLRTRALERHPDDVDFRHSLAEAYLLAGEPERALEIAGPCHRDRPDDPWIEDTVLDALFALGRTEDDYPWAGETPPVLRLDESCFDEVSAYLARVDGQEHLSPEARDEDRDLLVIYYSLANEAYVTFEPAELLAALEEDPRFVTEAAEGGPAVARVKAVGAS